MADEEFLVNGVPLSSLRVVDLKEELEKRGLSKIGVKSILMERMKDALMEESGTKKPPNPAVLAYKEMQDAMLQKARAADPRNKKSTVDDESSEQQQPDSATEDPPKEPDQVEPDSANNGDANNESSSSSSSSGSGSSSSGSDSEEDEKDENKNKEPSGKEMKEEVKSTASASLEEKPLMSTPEEAKKDSKVEKTPVEAEPKPILDVQKPLVATEEKPILESPEKEKTTPVKSVEKSSEPEKKTPAKEEKTNGLTKKTDDADLPKKPKESNEEEVELDYGEEPEDPAPREAVEEKPKAQEEEREKSEQKQWRKLSPASRHSRSDIVHIRGLVRPFTENALKRFISESGGEILDFWIDKVKSHCFAKLVGEENATAVIKALHGVHWPDGNPKTLSVAFDTEENLTRHKEGQAEVPKPTALTIGSAARESRASREEARKASAATPGAISAARNSLRITVEANLRENARRDAERGELRRTIKVDAAENGKSKDREREQRGRDRSREKERDREVDRKRRRSRSDTPPHSRARFDEKRKREEPVVIPKTLDELFKKTTAKPHIYYLPLTETQIKQKEATLAKEAKKSPSTRDKKRN